MHDPDDAALARAAAGDDAAAFGALVRDTSARSAISWSG